MVGTATQWLSVPEALRGPLKGKLSKNTVYDYIGAGVIPHVRVGRRILLPADALDRMLAAQQERDAVEAGR